MLRRVLLAAAPRRFASNAPNASAILAAAHQQQQAATRTDGAAAAALARALFVDEPAASPATESILSRVYEVDDTVASRAGATAPAIATVVERDVFATHNNAVPGALGEFKVVIEDLPKAATEEDIVRALSIDLDAMTGNKHNQKKHHKQHQHHHQQQTQQQQQQQKSTTLSGDATTSSGATPASSSSSSSEHAVGAPFAVEIFSDRFRGRERYNAFVYFVGEGDVLALQARATKFGVYIRGQRCPLYPASSKTCVFVGNLPHSIADESELREKFSLLRKFPSEYAINNAATKGFAFLIFPSHEEALGAFAQLVDPVVIDIWGRDLIVRWGAELRHDRSNMRDLLSQVTRLQAENYRLRLELAEINLKQKSGEN